MELLIQKYEGSIDDVVVDQIARMLLDLDKIHHKASPKRFPLISIGQRKLDVKNICKNGYIFSAETNGRIVAFASILKKESALVLEHLYVKPAFRSKDIGTNIVKKIIKLFPNKEIYTTAYAFNKEAIEFYGSLFELSSLVFKKKTV